MKKLFLFLALGAVLTGCSKREHDDTDNGNSNSIPITLTSKVELKTKNTLQDTQIENKQQVSFFVVKNGGSNEIVYNNEKLTAQGDGKFDYANKMYYPIEQGTVNFYAVHPYTSEAKDLATFNFSVNEDQTTRENFLNSDLLYGKVMGVTRTKNAVPVVFDHKLSKLTFKIVKGNGIELTGLSDLEIMNVLPQTSIEMLSGTVTKASGTPVNVSAYGVTGSPNAEIIGGMGAIIVPQTLQAGNKLFKITIDGADYYYTPTAETVFEGGKKYNYTLTISNTGIEVTSSITNWLPGGDIEGEGTLD